LRSDSHLGRRGTYLPGRARYKEAETLGAGRGCRTGADHGRGLVAVSELCDRLGMIEAIATARRRELLTPIAAAQLTGLTSLPARTASAQVRPDS